MNTAITQSLYISKYSNYRKEKMANSTLIASIGSLLISISIFYIIFIVGSILLGIRSWIVNLAKDKGLDIEIKLETKEKKLLELKKDIKELKQYDNPKTVGEHIENRLAKENKINNDK